MQKKILSLAVAAIVAISLVGVAAHASTQPTRFFDEFTKSEITLFLMEKGVINWAVQPCYHFLVNVAAGKIYCDGSTLITNDNNVSATYLCNLAGFAKGQVTGVGHWVSPHDNTLIRLHKDGAGNIFGTTENAATNNAYTKGVMCTEPFVQATPTPTPTATPTATPTPTKPQCSDGIDNDSDGKIDMADPGCKNPEDTDESDDPKQCLDRKDNDGDGVEDEKDPGCHTDGDATDGDDTFDRNDNDEQNGQCIDGKDNDGDSLIDRQDPDCHTDGDPNDGDDSFNGNRDENHNNRKPVKVVKAATVVAQPVAVTAKTGAGAIAGIATSLLGLTGLAFSLRRFIK